MKDYSKSPSSGKTSVRQIRGPGMNLGLKKSPRSKKPPPFKKGPAAKKGKKNFGSLLQKGFF